MTLLLPKEEIHWERAVEQLVQQHHTDLQRLWRRVPQRPQLPGIPLTGISFPGDPDEFGSANSFGPYSGSPYSGSASSGIQIARPSSDVIPADYWRASTGSAYWSLLDEVTPDDSDYIYTDVSFAVSGTTTRIALSSLSDPGRHTGHILRVRHKLDGSGSEGSTLTITLFSGGTTVALRNCTLSGSYSTEEFTLTNDEASLIGLYSDLSVELQGLTSVGNEVYVSWIEFEAPSS